MNGEDQILIKLGKIEEDIEEIKKHMVDSDSIMTEEDYEALLAYREEKKAGKLITHDQLKKELGL